MMKVGIQISSVKKYLQTPADVLESFKKCAEIGYKYIQIQWIAPSVPNEAVRDALLESGLECVGTQEAYREVQNLNKYIKMNQMWGGKYVCTSATGLDNTFSSVDECLNAARLFNEMAARLKGEGLIFAFHPHNAHIVKIDGTTSLDIIMENTTEDVQFNLDMYHIRTSGNGTPSEWLRKAAGRADMTHFKDYKVIDSNRVLCPVGQGVLEWADIFRACSETGVKYCFAEQEDWEKDAFECLAEAYEYITANLNL